MPKLDQAEIILKGRLNGNQKNRLAKLLNMMYRPSELASEIGFNVRQVYRVYIPLGLPHERDERNHIWIHGVTFREWVKDVYKKRKLNNDQAFCLTCKRAVKMKDKIRIEKGRLVYYLCDCPHCGRKLARILNKKRKSYDQPGKLGNN
jgi:hypothetical protein